MSFREKTGGGCFLRLQAKKMLNLVIAKFNSIQFNQIYLNTVNGSASWFSDMPCKNYELLVLKLVIN